MSDAVPRLLPAVAIVTIFSYLARKVVRWRSVQTPHRLQALEAKV
jgi:hypothetical protein